MGITVDSLNNEQKLISELDERTKPLEDSVNNSVFLEGAGDQTLKDLDGLKYLGLGTLLGAYPGAFFLGINMSDRKNILAQIESLNNKQMQVMDAKNLTEYYIKKHPNQYAEIEGGYIKLSELYRNVKNRISLSTGKVNIVSDTKQVLKQGQYAQWLKNNAVKNTRLGILLTVLGTIIGLGIGAGIYLNKQNTT